jgi:hypothetical protein
MKSILLSPFFSTKRGYESSWPDVSQLCLFNKFFTAPIFFAIENPGGLDLLPLNLGLFGGSDGDIWKFPT